MNKIINRLKEQQQFEYTIFNSIPLIIKDKFTNNIDIKKLITSLETLLPQFSKSLVNSIIILDHPLFSKRKINAFYDDNILYISNDQEDNNDLLDDIVHEYSHALEEEYGAEIYFDNTIKDEFLLKRQQLERILRSHQIDVLNYNFRELNYNLELDKLFLDVVGYEKFQNLTNHGLFINPYAATSLREYFATGFEEYVLGDHKEFEVISPNLYNKLKEILK